MHPDDRIDPSVSAPLVAFLATLDEDRPRVVVGSRCRECDGRVFALGVDQQDGVAVRACLACDVDTYIGDGAEFADEAEIGQAECPCGGDDFEIAVAFALGGDGTVRWITVAARCLADDAAGVYADWKIDYTPTDHLLTAV